MRGWSFNLDKNGDPVDRRWVENPPKSLQETAKMVFEEDNNMEQFETSWVFDPNSTPLEGKIFLDGGWYSYNFFEDDEA